MKILKTRRLAAMMFTDVVGYSSMMEKNEVGTLALLQEHKSILREILSTFHGREIRTIGDAFFIEFPSVVDAVECAYEIQSRLFEWNLNVAKDMNFNIRIGIHMGDIIDSENDAFGNEVNISARIESHAEPGGISVSQQVLDQVKGKLSYQFRTQGTVKLKNISEKLSIYSLVLPWKTDQKNLSLWGEIKNHFIKTKDLIFSSRDFAIRTLLAVMVFGMTLNFIVPVFQSFKQSLSPTVFLAGTRGPASIAEEQDLSRNWFINSDPQANQSQWDAFLPSQAWDYSDRIHGEYWLKKEFIPHSQYLNPAIVLGLIPDKHRVYLNNTLVGGSEQANPVPFYSFSPQMLKIGETNELLVKAYTNGTLKPGLSIVPRVGAALGDISDISVRTRKDLVQYHFLRFAYLIITGIFFTGSLLYFVLNPISRHYLYFSIFSLLGFMMLIYHNPIFSDQLDFQSYSFLKLFPLALSGIILMSGYFALKGKRSAELRNNFAGLIVGVILAAYLLMSHDSQSSFQAKLNLVYLLSFLYGITFGTYVFANWCAQLKLYSDRSRSETFGNLAHETAVLLFIGFNALHCYISTRGAPIPSLSDDFKDVLQQVLVLTPVIFSGLFTVIALVDYTVKNRSLQNRRLADTLLLALNRSIAETEPKRRIIEVHRLICEFIGASQSTAYSLNEEHPHLLTSCSAISESQNRSHLAYNLNLQQDFLGHLMVSRHPILIRNIQKDLRFRSYLEKEASMTAPESIYSSLMAFPIESNNKMIGVLTFTEKADKSPFSRRDFYLVRNLISHFSLLLAADQGAIKDAEATDVGTAA